MFPMISWIVAGAVLGSVGVAVIASFAAGDGPRGDPNLDKIFFLLFMTTVAGATGGGLFARMAKRKFADNPRRLDQLALFPLLAAALLVGYVLTKS